MFNDPRDNNTGGNAAAAFDAMSVRNRAYLVTVIRLFLRPAKAINCKHTSYGLKHLTEKLMPDGYVSNGEMKGAMLYCGYRADGVQDINWEFNVLERSELFTTCPQRYSEPISDRMRAAVRTAVEEAGDNESALMRCKDCALNNSPSVEVIRFYDWAIDTYSGQDNPRGDLASDMKHDRAFPREDDKAAILAHLRRRHACRDAIAAFEGAWKRYRSRRRYGE